MLSINISELIWTVINFFLLFFLLRHFLYKPICAHMDARQARIDAGLAQERAARDALQAENDRLEQEKQAAREQARLQLQQAETQAEQARVEELRRAKQSARAAEQKTREEMQAQIRQDGEVLAAAEPALAELLTRKLLEKGERT